MIKHIIPSVSSELRLERHCPHCGRENGNIRSGIRYRGISDLKVNAVAQRRMKCPWCKTTWGVRGVKNRFVNEPSGNEESAKEYTGAIHNHQIGKAGSYCRW